MRRRIGMNALALLLVVSMLLTPLSQGSVSAAPGDAINIALGKAVSASSSYEMSTEGWAMANLVDGSKTGPREAGSPANGFTTRPAASQPPAGSPAWVMIDLGAVYGTDRIVLWPRSDNGTHNIGGGFPIDYKVLVSQNDDVWTEVASRTDYPAPTDGSPLELSFDVLQARYVKVEATRLQGVTGELVMQFREIEVFQAESDLPDDQVVASDYETLTLPATQGLFSSINLPTYGVLGSTITWSSSNPAVVAHDGKVTRPVALEPGEAPMGEAVLTATLSRGTESVTKEFTLTVKPHRYREPLLEDEFQIGIFWPPTWEYTNDLQYQWIKEANVDIVQNVIGSGLDTEERNMKMLEIAERYDLKVNVADPRIRGTDAQIQEVVETYKDYWGTGGYYIRDEPGIGELPREAHIYQEVLKHDDTKNPYVNLFPNIYGAAYEPEYIRRWVELVGKDNLQYLSYDNYPFMQSGVFDNGYYDMADIIRRVGLENDVKTASYLQSVGYGSSPGNLSHRSPSETDMRFSVYSYLAYGFKYVTWFTYWTPTGRGEHFENAIIDPQGNKTAMYAPFQQLNGEMKQLGKTLIKLDAMEVYHTGVAMPTPNTKRVPETFYLTPVNENDEMIISYMVHKETNETYAMVVNKSFTQTSEFALKTNAAIPEVREISKSTGLAIDTNYDPATRMLSAMFMPGEGKLFALGSLPPYVGPQQPNVLPDPITEGRHPLSNLALNQKVTASSDVGNWGWKKELAVDGQRVGGAGGDDDKGWTSLPVASQPNSPEWIMIDLGRPYEVSEVTLWPRNDGGTNRGVGFPVDYKVLLSTDQENWTTVVHLTDVAQPVAGHQAVHEFTATSARYVRVEASKLRVDPNGAYAFQLAEIEVFQSDPGTLLQLKAGATNLLVGQTTQVTASQWLENETLVPASEATFESSDHEVVTVNEAGLVTAVGPGTAAIQVQAPFAGGGGFDQTELEITVAELSEPWQVSRFGNTDAIIIPSVNTFDIQAAGAGPGSETDELVFVNQPVQGINNALTSTISSFAIPNAAGATAGRTGLMFRQAEQDSGALVYLAVSPQGRIELMSRSANGEITTISSSAFTQLPITLKLVQAGQRFTGYYMQGSEWYPIAGSLTASSVNVGETSGWVAGAAAYSALPARFNRTVFNDVSLTTVDPDNADVRAVEAAAAAISLGNLDAVSGDITLPATGEQETLLTWISSNTEYMRHDGKLLKRPSVGQADITLTLTAVVTRGGAAYERVFTLTIKAQVVSSPWIPPVAPPVDDKDDDVEPPAEAPVAPETPGNGGGMPAPVVLKDIAGHWAQAAIEHAVSLGIVTGYSDNTFQASKPVGRDEFVAMLARSLKFEGDGSGLAFKDADRIQAWARPYVAQAIEAGIITGYSDNTFRPKAQINRVEMAVMIVRGLGLPVNEQAELTFADAALIPSWARPYVAAAYEAGIISGRGDNRFAPLENATRAEAITMIMRMLDQQ